MKCWKCEQQITEKQFARVTDTGEIMHDTCAIMEDFRIKTRKKL